MSSSQTALPGSSRHSDTVTRDLYALLDTLLAVRMDLGHDANGTAGSPPLGLTEMREVRRMVEGAISLTKDVIGSVHDGTTE